MINVVGAGEDPENLKPATLYNFSPTQKKAPEPVKPVPKPDASPLVPMPAAIPASALPETSAAVPELTPVVPEPLPDKPAPEIQAPPKPKKTSSNLLIAGLIGLIVLVGGGAVALYLGQTNQDVRQQASTFTAPENQPPTSPPLEPTTEPPETEDVEQLALGPTLSPTPAPTTSPTPTTAALTDTLEFCNDSCLADENCQNLTHACVSGKCRLGSNPSNNLCQTPSGGSQVAVTLAQSQRTYSAYAEPTGETPQSGPEDWLRYFWVGVATIGIGGVFLLLL